MITKQVTLIYFKIVLIIESWILLCSAMSPRMSEKTWTYDLISVESKSSNEDILTIDWHADRVSRGVYAVFGSFTWNYDVVEGDNTEIEMTSMLSENGVDNFKVLPFKTPRQHVFEFFNTFYKDMAMETLRTCSDLPAFENKFVPPFEKKTYTLNGCQFSQDGYPQHLNDGFYKIIVSGYGPVDWSNWFKIQEQSLTKIINCWPNERKGRVKDTAVIKNRVYLETVTA